MKKVILLAYNLLHESKGVTSIEYALVASLIAMGIILGVGALGSEVKILWDHIANCVVHPGDCT